MGFLWNHWFWITVGVFVCVNIEASENSKQYIEDEGPVSLPAGARGGKALLLPPPEHYSDVNRFDLELGPTRRPIVSVSKSVSKVSVKRGKVSVNNGHDSLAKISDIYVDRGIRNRSPIRPRKIQPYYIGYNLVYREPLAEKKKLAQLKIAPPSHPPPPPPVNILLTHPPRRGPPSNPNIGLLATIIAKLKSLAEATSSRIKFSNLLKEPVLLTTEATTTTSTTTTPGTPEQLVEEAGQLKEQQHVLVRVDDLGVTTGEETEFDVVEDERVNLNQDRPRSLEARGRSLPFLQELESLPDLVEDLPSQDWEAGEDQHTLQQEEEEEAVEEMVEELQEEEILEDVLEVETNDISGDIHSQELIQQGDFIEDFTAPEYSFTGSEDDKISAERIDQSNISAVIGVILGIIIFVIISIVLVLLGVQRRHMKNIKTTEPAEDVISQASYMTYSTTVSDHSVNYGPANWEKDICEDLCSLDNDSFLNSLEAVTTTDYWGTDHY